MNQGQVVVAPALPADAQAAKVVVPAIGALDYPATRSTANAAQQRWLAATANVWANAAATYFALGVRVVVALVEAQVAWPARSARCTQWNRVERRAGQPLVVDVGAGERHADGHATLIGQDVTLGAELAPIGRIGAGMIPPLGAFTEALSSEAQSHAIPRSSS